MMHDISRRVTSRSRRRRTAHYLQHILDAVPAPIGHKDAQGRYVAVNRAFAEAAGLPGTARHPRTRPQTSSLRRSPPSSGSTTRAARQRRLRRPGHGRHDAALGRPAVELHRSVYADLAGRPAGIVGVEIDVTDAVQTTEALRTREALLRGLFDTMPSGCAVYEVRGDGRSGADYIIQDMNRTAVAQEGSRKEDLIGKSLLALWPPDRRMGPDGGPVARLAHRRRRSCSTRDLRRRAYAKVRLLRLQAADRSTSSRSTAT